MISGHKKVGISPMKIRNRIRLLWKENWYNDMQKDKQCSSMKYCLSQIIAYANIAGYEISVLVRYKNCYIL